MAMKGFSKGVCTPSLFTLLFFQYIIFITMVEGENSYYERFKSVDTEGRMLNSNEKEIIQKLDALGFAACVDGIDIRTETDETHPRMHSTVLLAPREALTRNGGYFAMAEKLDQLLNEIYFAPEFQGLRFTTGDFALYNDDTNRVHIPHLSIEQPIDEKGNHAITMFALPSTQVLDSVMTMTQDFRNSRVPMPVGKFISHKLSEIGIETAEPDRPKV